MNFSTIEEIERYVQNELKISNVNFSRINLEVAKDIAEGLKTMINFYPKMQNYIEGIGNPLFLWNEMEQLKLFASSDEIQDINYMQEKQIKRMNEVSSNPMTVYPIQIGGKQRVCFELEPSLADKNKQNVLANIAKIRKHNEILAEDSIQSVLYHEFAHALDDVLKISKDTEVFSILIHSGVNSEEFYYNSKELLAEGFAVYYSSVEPPLWSELLVSYINYKYQDKFTRCPQKKMLPRKQ